MSEADPKAHSQPDAHDCFVSDCGFDRFEQSVLDISRRFFSTLAKPESHQWMEAFEVSEHVLPPPFGATLGLAVLRCVRTMRTSRTTCFSFINANCRICSQSITQEERHFISILRAMRRGQRSDAMAFATMVCEGQDPGALVASFEQLCIAIRERH